MKRYQVTATANRRTTWGNLVDAPVTRASGVRWGHPYHGGAPGSWANLRRVEGFVARAWAGADRGKRYLRSTTERISMRTNVLKNMASDLVEKTGENLGYAENAPVLSTLFHRAGGKIQSNCVLIYFSVYMCIIVTHIYPFLKKTSSRGNVYDNNTHKKGPLLSAYYFYYSYHQTGNYAETNQFSPGIRSKMRRNVQSFGNILRMRGH